MPDEPTIEELQRQARAGGELGMWAQQEIVKRSAAAHDEFPSAEYSRDDSVWNPSVVKIDSSDTAEVAAPAPVEKPTIEKIDKKIKKLKKLRKQLAAESAQQ